MKINYLFKRLWTWRRDRAARRLRERLFAEMPKLGLGIRAMKAAEDYHQPPDCKPGGNRGGY